MATEAVCKDHPRPCGEKVQLNPDRLAPLGSPPPMRGKVKETEARYGIKRITPAHAGKSADWCMAMANGQDHPRPCGEKPLKTSVG